MLGRRVVRGYYQPPPRGYSKELVRTIKLLLNVNPEKRLDIIDLLNSPFLRRRMGEGQSRRIYDFFFLLHCLLLILVLVFSLD